MRTGTHRPRLRPALRLGIRRGRHGSSTMELLERSPYDLERLVRIGEELRAAGVESVPLDRVRAPLQYDRG